MRGGCLMLGGGMPAGAGRGLCKAVYTHPPAGTLPTRAPPPPASPPQLLSPEDCGRGFSEVGALQEAKQALREAVQLPLQHPELFAGGWAQVQGRAVPANRAGI
jgi:hypothetical protein